MKIGSLEVYGVIYKITNTITGQVYIGQTTKEKGFNGRYCFKGNGIERVYNYHLNCKEKGYESLNSYLFNSINKYGFESFEITEVLDVAFSKKELDIKEMTYISIYDSYKNGYNQNMGGDGNKGHNGLKGSNNPRSRSVVQMDLNGNYIKTWDYINDAVNENIADISSIIRSCNNKKYHGGGFLWEYCENYDPNFDYKHLEKRKTTKRIKQLDLNDNLIEIYDSIVEACNKNNYHYKSLSRCCNGNRKTYKNFKWIYAD